MPQAHSASTVARTLCALATLASATFVGVSPATAHDEIVSTNPADGTSLTEAPRQLELTFSGDIMEMDGANQVRVTNAAGENVTQGEPKVQGTNVTQALQASSADDTYTVAWRVVSSDGHPIQGTFTYDVGQGAPATSDPKAAAQATSGTAASSATATDPVDSATAGLSTPLKVILAVAAAAALGASLTVVLARTQRK